MLEQPKDLKIHFVGFGPMTLGLDSYIAIKSAANVYGVKPIFWGIGVNPDDIWFRRIQEIAQIEVVPYVVEQFVSRLGYLAQKADYIRYCALVNHGGLYLDSDSICVRSIFELSELQFGVTVGWETTWNLFNGVMYVDRPFDADMVKICAECYSMIEKNDVPVYGSLGPILISNLDAACNVLATSRDFKLNELPACYFSYYPSGQWRNWLQENNTLDECIYVVHWWGAHARQTVQQLTPEYLRNSTSFFAQAVRKSLKDDPYVFSKQELY